MIKSIVTMIVALLLVGCMSVDQKAALKDKAHTAILEYVQDEGYEKVIEYIDKLVAEGKLGKANADKIKEALPKGIDKLKEVMGEIENE